jgi:hypothetical protein
MPEPLNSKTPVRFGTDWLQTELVVCLFSIGISIGSFAMRTGNPLRIQTVKNQPRKRDETSTTCCALVSIARRSERFCSLSTSCRWTLNWMAKLGDSELDRAIPVSSGLRSCEANSELIAREWAAGKIPFRHNPCENQVRTICLTQIESRNIKRIP